MHKLAPSVPTNVTPNDIIGKHEDLVNRHFQATYRPFNDNFEQAVKKFTNDERETVARIYAELRENGFYPLGFTIDGKPRWGYTVRLQKENQEK